MNRHKGHQGKPPHRGAERRPARRMPPPEATGEEAGYIARLKESTTPIVVYLLDGTEVRGHIEYFDRELIKVTRPEGPHILLRKTDIRYLAEEGTSSS